MTDGGIWQPRDLPVLPPLAEPVAPAPSTESEPIEVDEVEPAPAIALAPALPEPAAVDEVDTDEPIVLADGQTAEAAQVEPVEVAEIQPVEAAAAEHGEPQKMAAVVFSPEVLEADLLAVDAALVRLDNGGYGHCEVCNLTLDDAVMAADPTVAVCPAHVGLRPAIAS